MTDTKLRGPVAAGESRPPSPTESGAETPALEHGPETPQNTSDAASRYSPVIIRNPNGVTSQLADFAAFLKRTWRIWAIAFGMFLGLVLIIAVFQKLTEMAKDAQQKRYEKAIASVTPEHLIARCGKPAEDVTKEVFPVILRTIRYDRGSSEKLSFAFSRTAEQQSDWVFLTMKDENGTRNFDTPESKILAFSCLDSTK